MPRSRSVLAAWLLALLLALVLPAVSLAGGGGSAGDQQYTDPFSGSSTPHSTSTAAPGTTPSPTTAPAASAPATSAPASSGDPTATIATATDPTSPSATLPYTGYDLWTGAGFGLTMIAGGIVLRRRAQRS